MAVQSDWLVADHLLAFVSDTVDWTEVVAGRFLDSKMAGLSQAIGELRDQQLPQLRRDLQEVPPEEFVAAGFSRAQTILKTDIARDAMEEAATALGRDHWRLLTADVDLVTAAAEAIKEVLGSIKSVSRWIEAVAELVGMVSAAAKKTIAVRRLHAGRRRRPTSG